MSARTYKAQLDVTLSKLNNAITSAREWRQVASNRLLLLEAIDAAINTQIYGLMKIGTIFGVAPEDPESPVANSGIHSADEMTSFILQKLMCASSFTANLTAEAVSLQEKLSGVLSIALEAVSVDRPIADLKINDYSSYAKESSSPLKDVFDQVNDIPYDRDRDTFGEAFVVEEQADVVDTNDSTPDVVSTDAPELPSNRTNTEMSSALALFHR